MSSDSGPDRFDAILILATLACLGVGLGLLNLCAGGDSLVLFGLAFACLGGVLFRSGAWATALPCAFGTLVLVGTGLYGATVAGCHI